MSQSTYLVRLLGGRNLTAVYDNVAGTVTVAGQNLALSTISTALQNQFTAAIASGSGANPASGMKGTAACSGDNVSAAIGSIMDATPAWRAAVAAAMANVTDAAATASAGV